MPVWLRQGAIVMDDGAVIVCDDCPCPAPDEPRTPTPCCDDGWRTTLYLVWDHGQAVVVVDTSTIPPTWVSTQPGGSHSGTYLGESLDTVQVYCEFNAETQLSRVTVSFIIEGGSNIDHYYDYAGPFCTGQFPIEGGEWTGGGTSTENVILSEEPL